MARIEIIIPKVGPATRADLVRAEAILPRFVVQREPANRAVGVDWLGHPETSDWMSGRKRGETDGFHPFSPLYHLPASGPPEFSAVKAAFGAASRACAR